MYFLLASGAAEPHAIRSGTPHPGKKPKMCSRHFRTVKHTRHTVGRRFTLFRPQTQIDPVGKTRRLTLRGPRRGGYHGGATREWRNWQTRQI